MRRLDADKINNDSDSDDKIGLRLKPDSIKITFSIKIGLFLIKIGPY